MSVKKVKLHFDAAIDKDANSMEMSIEWEASVEYAVAVICTAAEKHPQIYEAILISAESLKREAFKSESRRIAELMMSTLEDLDPDEVSKEDQEEIANQLKAMGGITPQGDA